MGPYLFRCKKINSAREFVQSLVDATLSSSEETIFGNTLEDIAIGICEHFSDGRKSIAEGIDLEFNRASALHIVSVKSGSNWGNADQRKRMSNNFTRAKQRYRQREQKLTI